MKKIIALLFAVLLCTAAFAQAAVPVSGPAVVSATVVVGAHVTFSVTATGTTPLAFQWQKKNADGSYTSIAAATATQFILTAAQATDTGLYRCVVSNPIGVTATQDGSLTVGNPPAVTGATITSP